MGSTEGEIGGPVLIPLRGSDQSVHIHPDCLPDDVYDVIEVLRSEAAQREVWTRTARTFDAASRLMDCIRILEDALRPEMERILSSTEKDGRGKVELLVTLGGAYIMQAADEAEDEREKEELLDRAADALNRAETIFVGNPVVWEAKAWREIYASNLDRARSCFETAVNIGNMATVAGRLGMAALLLNFNDSSNAAKLFRATMRNVRCPASAWLGLGHALYSSGSVRRAKESFQKAIESAEGSLGAPVDTSEALICLATIHANDTTQNGVQEAFSLLLQAFRTLRDAKLPLDPRVLCHMSELLFYSGDVERSGVFARRAVEAVNTATPPGVKADAHLQLARFSHANGNYEEAEKRYKHALQILSQRGVTTRPMQLDLGCGLLEVASGDQETAKDAVDHLQRVLKINEKCSIARRALGVAFARSVLSKSEVEEDDAVVEPRREQAKALLKRGITEEGGDADIPALLSYAQLMELSEPLVAIDAYTKALKALKDSSAIEPLELLNNVAALQARNYEYTDAKATLRRAMEVARKTEGIPEGDPLGPKYITLSYNYARLMELEGDFHGAEELFRDLTQRYEDYSDAHIRLGHILKSRGDFAGAEECAKRAIAGSSPSAKTFGTSFLASIYRQKKDFAALQKVLEQASESHMDKYAEVALISFWNDNITSMEPGRRQRMLERIHRGFSKVLRDSPSNALAAAGVGCFLAANGQMSDARDVFASIVAHRYSGDMLRVNLAHTQVEIGKENLRWSKENRGTKEISYFEQAAKLYDDAIKKSPGGSTNVELHLYYARAVFEAGDYKEALKIMQKVIRLGPQYLPLWYDLALILQECSLERMDKNSKVVAQIKRGTAELDRAHRLFGRLRTCAPYEGSGPARAKPPGQSADAHYRYCKDRLNKARVVLVNAEQEEKNAIDRLEQQHREIAESEAREREAKLLALRKEEEKLRELEERQRELDEKVKMDLIRGQEEAQESDRQESDENENTPKPQERNIVKKRKVVADDEKPAREGQKIRRLKKPRRQQWSDSESERDGSNADDDFLQIFGDRVEDDDNDDDVHAEKASDHDNEVVQEKGYDRGSKKDVLSDPAAMEVSKENMEPSSTGVSHTTSNVPSNGASSTETAANKDDGYGSSG